MDESFDGENNVFSLHSAQSKYASASKMIIIMSMIFNLLSISLRRDDGDNDDKMTMHWPFLLFDLVYLDAI